MDLYKLITMILLLNLATGLVLGAAAGETWATRLGILQDDNLINTVATTDQKVEQDSFYGVRSADDQDPTAGGFNMAQLLYTGWNILFVGFFGAFANIGIALSTLQTGNTVLGLVGLGLMFFVNMLYGMAILKVIAWWRNRDTT